MNGEHYYIDGYNLLFALAPLDADLQEERYAMIQDLLEKTQFLRLDATVVFDSAYYREEGTRSHISDLEIVYTEYGESADDYIVNEVSISSSPHHEVVVTSDKALARRVRELKGKTMSVLAFVKWLNKRCLKKKAKKTNKPSLLEKENSSIPPDHYLTAFQSEPEERPRKLSEEERWLEIFEQRLKDLDTKS